MTTLSRAELRQHVDLVVHALDVVLRLDPGDPLTPSRHARAIEVAARALRAISAQVEGQAAPLAAEVSDASATVN